MQSVIANLISVISHKDSNLDVTNVKIWYTKQNTDESYFISRDLLCFGSAAKDISEICSENIKETHTLIAEVSVATQPKLLENIYKIMQGEIWSPNGEAYDFILNSETRHTSMSVGDIIQLNETLFMVDKHGFTNCKKD